MAFSGFGEVSTECEFPNKLPAAVIHENELLAAKAKLALIITNYGVIMNFWLDDWK